MGNLCGGQSNETIQLEGSVSKQKSKHQIDKHFSDLKLKSDHSKEIVDQLKVLLEQSVHQELYRSKAQSQAFCKHNDAFFYPDPNGSPQKVIDNIRKTQKHIRLAVYSFTNNLLANEIKAKIKQGVKVQIISDDEEMRKDIYADVMDLCLHGAEVRCDSDKKALMHNKFYVSDDSFVMTGSFNWTKGAVCKNQENVIVVSDPFYVNKYTREFDTLWKKFDKNQVSKEEAQRWVTQNEKNFKQKKPYNKYKR